MDVKQPRRASGAAGVGLEVGGGLPVRSGGAPVAPATFAVHDIGGLGAMHLAPFPLDALADALDDLGVEHVFGAGRLRIPPALLAALEPPLEVTSAFCELPVLAAPHASVGEAPGAFAACISEAGEGILYTPSEPLLVAVLRRWLSLLLEDSGVEFGLDGVPDAALAPLVAPMPLEHRSAPRLTVGSRLHTLEFRTTGVGSRRAEGAPRARWIGAPRYGWRCDWEW